MSKANQILLIAGEKSGEEHALSFVPDLLEKFPHLHFYGVGGDSLKNNGMELLYHLRDFSSWGFTEVIGKIPFYFKALKNIEAEVERRNTKIAILIDFQDFNMRLAKKISKKGVKVLYYVAPQAWAWKEWRTKVLEEYTHTLFTIIPFEEQWFKERGVQRVSGVSHPLWHHYHQRIDDTKLDINAKPFDKFTKSVELLLLPGSRNFEVEGLLNEFFDAIDLLKSRFNFKISIVRSPNVNEKIYEPWVKRIQKIYESEELSVALEKADLAFAASGTVTLTCAIFQVPTVVAYKSSLLNVFIYYTFIRYDGPISLANIVHQKRIFPELTHNMVSGYNLAARLSEWLTRRKSYETIKSELKKTIHLIDKSDSDITAQMSEVIQESYG